MLLIREKYISFKKVGLSNCHSQSTECQNFLVKIIKQELLHIELGLNCKKVIELNFAEQLRAKKNSKVVEFANEFAEKIKPLLVCAAEEGYSKFRYGIETNSSEELSLYSDQYFIEKLSENLDGVEVNFKEESKEHEFFNFCVHEYYLEFRW